MKVTLLKKLRREFNISERGGMYRYRRVFNSFDGQGSLESEWSDNIKDVLQERNNRLLEYARANYSTRKN